jgi:hypothetical protein
MNEILTESLFTPGGTLTEKDIIKTPYGYIAANDIYIFFSQGKKCIKVKYQTGTDFVSKPLKTKILIGTRERFLKVMQDDLFYFVQRGLFQHYFN